jgi:hypothetical protein
MDETRARSLTVGPESPDSEGAVVAHMQEIEYALVLQRMIDAVKSDPKQLRVAVYEFARARLKVDTAAIEDVEKERLSTALEMAIQGVEQFSVRQQDRERPAYNPASQIGYQPSSSEPSLAEPPSSVARLEPIDPAPADILSPQRPYLYQEAPIVEVRTVALIPTLVRFLAATAVLGTVVGLAYYNQKGPQLGERPSAAQPASGTEASANAAPQSAQAIVSAPPPAPLPFPVPSDYGTYAVNNGELIELHLLPVRVPDKRIVMSTPLNRPSQTTLSDGKVKFIVYRRDMMDNAPDRMEVRVVAKVARTISFDPKGRPVISPIADAWNIRNVTYEFRVRPVPGHPEMLLVQPDTPDFALSPGRYVLVLRDQGFDFTVAGKVTDLAQCLERTDAANGEFYSACQKL